MQDVLELRERKWVSRGGDRGDHLPAGPDGWAVAGSNPARQPPKAGDLSNFGKIKKDQPLTFGPSSVFTNKMDSKKEPILRTASGTNMLSMVSGQNAENGDAAVKCELLYIPIHSSL